MTSTSEEEEKQNNSKN